MHCSIDISTPPALQHSFRQMGGPGRLAGLCLLLLVFTHAQTGASGAEGSTGGAGAAAGAAAPDGGKQAQGQQQQKQVQAAAAAQAVPRSFCNDASEDFNGTKPVPCTDEQEEDALSDLVVSPDPTLSGLLSPGAELPPPDSLLDASSVCNSTDAEGFVESVSLMDPDVLEVATAVADAYVAAASEDSYWQSLCEGDLLTDPWNACKLPELADPNTGEAEGTWYKLQMGLECAEGKGDKIGLEAEAYLLKDAAGTNNTVLSIEWLEIPLPLE